MTDKAYWMVVMWRDSVPESVHFVNAEPEKDWYISRVSMGAYRNNENTKFSLAIQKYKSYDVPGLRGNVEFGSKEYLQLTSSWLVSKKLPTTEHDSVWDFYKAVGYDYKKKRYV